MNPWYILAIQICVFLTLFICFIVFLVMLITAIAKAKLKKKHKPIKVISVLLSMDVILLAFLLIFVLSHPTYYKYNDWAIQGSHISDVQKRYGDFDVGTVRTGHPGEVGYYIYTDDGPIMPDHLPHYYYIHYDENGIVDSVKDSIPEGG